VPVPYNHLKKDKVDCIEVLFVQQYNCTPKRAKPVKTGDAKSRSKVENHHHDSLITEKSKTSKSWRHKARGSKVGG
jgi:hypothetical protein